MLLATDSDEAAAEVVAALSVPVALRPSDMAPNEKSSRGAKEAGGRIRGGASEEAMILPKMDVVQVVFDRRRVGGRSDANQGKEVDKVGISEVDTTL